MLGLREIVKTTNLSMPDIFTDETFNKSNHFTLSTSQVKLLRYVIINRCVV